MRTSLAIVRGAVGVVVWVSLGGLALLAPGVGLAAAADAERSAEARAADEVVGELDGLAEPEIEYGRIKAAQAPDGEADPVLVEAARREQARYAGFAARVVRLTDELAAIDPEHPRLASSGLLARRWRAMEAIPEEHGRLLEETWAALSDGSAGRGVRLNAALRWISASSRREPDGVWWDYELGRLRAAAAACDAAYPGNDASAFMLFEHAVAGLEPDAALLEEIARSYPGSSVGGEARDLLDLLGRVGEPWPLGFVDAVSGERVTSASLAGRVVVLDFWATWCVPCIAAMPALRELRESYGGRVEVVGVSFDAHRTEPIGETRDRVRAFCSERAVAWPQMVPDLDEQREIKQRAAIVSVPTVFVLDGEGRLRSVNARGRERAVVEGLLAGASGAGEGEGEGEGVVGRE